MSSVDNILLLQ